MWIVWRLAAYLLKFRFLVCQALFKLLVGRHHHLEALFVPALDGLHLHAEVLHCLVQVLDD